MVEARAETGGWLRAALAIALLLAGAAVTLSWIGRLPICACGTVKLWHGVASSAENSQHLSDWYSLSHILHGVIFYALLALAAYLGWIAWPVPARLVAATVVEIGWEILENTPLIIERYRAATVSLGYTGDSIVNSLSDVGMMILGFLIAWRAPVWASVSMLIGFELLALYAIRDNLTLNIVMLVYPLETIRLWQAAV